MATEATALNRIDRLLAKISGGNPDLRFRAEVVLAIGALAILTVTSIGISELIWGTFAVGIACLVGSLAIVPILVVLVRSGQVARAATQFMGALYLIAAVLNVGSGGQTIGASVALPSLVLVGAMVLSSRAAIVLFLAVVAQLVVVSILDRTGIQFPIQPDPEWSHFAIFRVPLIISFSTAFIGLLVRRAMYRHRMELARTQQELADNEKRLREIIEFSRGLICTHSIDGVLLSANPAAEQALGYETGDLIGWDIRDLVPEEPKAYFADYLNCIKSNNVATGSIFLNARNGDLRVWEYNNRLCVDSAGEPYVLVNATDMTERRKLEEKLREQNIRDPLTGCFNRRYISIQESRFGEDQHWACIIIDLDNFKQVNDTHGHRRGDEILVAIGNFLNQYVGRHDAVIRMGGDEFLLLLADGGAEVESLAQRIRHAADSEAPCELTIGYAARIGDESLQQTIDRADLQLYRVRNSERRDSKPAEQ
ncbi:MAG TPA: diguanylate cyclase [Dokdonella sp.]|uniref:diguanylate cyclase n=1 Tax=Dokdonella sp. TaxID=2291710 RepID=UPI002D7FBB04|nr:diguanylate cyclase [Dokdonella sp.]HET9031493.1 diguanylate cyclase [Dokdonella sp.]